MPKKTIKKKRVKKTSKRISSPNKALEENMIALQKVLLQLMLKVDRLTTKMSDLLELFENSARALTEKDLEQEKEQKNVKQILGKMDNLFEQNKILARGLTMMHERNSGNIEPETSEKIQPQNPPQEKNPGLQGYQQSIASPQNKK